MPAVPAMQVLCIFGITRAINSTIGSIFHGIGKPNIITFGAGFQLIVLAAIIYPLTSKWGIFGTSLAVVIPNVLVMLYLSKKLASAMNYRSAHFISSLLPPIIGGAIMGVAMFFFQIWTDGSLISFLFSILLGLGVYLIVMYKMDRTFNYGLKRNLRQLLKGTLKNSFY